VYDLRTNKVTEVQINGRPFNKDWDHLIITGSDLNRQTGELALYGSDRQESSGEDHVWLYSVRDASCRLVFSKYRIVYTDIGNNAVAWGADGNLYFNYITEQEVKDGPMDKYKFNGVFRYTPSDGKAVMLYKEGYLNFVSPDRKWLGVYTSNDTFVQSLLEPDKKITLFSLVGCVSDDRQTIAFRDVDFVNIYRLSDFGLLARIPADILTDSTTQTGILFYDGRFRVYRNESGDGETVRVYTLDYLTIR
jgi:hypothetical protein